MPSEASSNHTLWGGKTVNDEWNQISTDVTNPLADPAKLSKSSYHFAVGYEYGYSSAETPHPRLPRGGLLRLRRGLRRDKFQSNR